MAEELIELAALPGVARRATSRSRWTDGRVDWSRRPPISTPEGALSGSVGLMDLDAAPDAPAVVRGFGAADPAHGAIVCDAGGEEEEEEEFNPDSDDGDFGDDDDRLEEDLDDDLDDFDDDDDDDDEFGGDDDEDY